MTDCTKENPCDEESFGRCIDGILYGWCTSEFCNGVCEMMGDCGCECHREGEGASAPEVCAA